MPLSSEAHEVRATRPTEPPQTQGGRRTPLQHVRKTKFVFADLGGPGSRTARIGLPQKLSMLCWRSTPVSSVLLG